MARLKARYNEELKAKLQEELSIKNVMEIPRITKITLNMGVGAAATDKEIIRWRCSRHAINCWSKTSNYTCS